ncbi:MAG TPA: CocE/NonD family hydrolase [Ferruginibacter sp.]|nr:CocE/NonD family hydrolase [Ferruginibacter sp.]
MQRIVIFLVCISSSVFSWAQNADSTWFRNNYTKVEKYIPMRDGIKLFTTFYIPKDQSEKHPFLMMRTPYSCYPYGEDTYAGYWNNFRFAYIKERYVMVIQDVRGRYMSEGKFEDVRPFIKEKKTSNDIDEASDTWDTVDWMLKNIENNNGQVGVLGTSYPGFYATEAALSGHPAIKAVSPQAPVTDWFIGDDFHHKGVFFAMDGFFFYSSFGKPHPAPTKDYGEGYTPVIKDNYAFFLKAGALKNLSAMIGDSIAFWHEMMKHPNYDAWWKSRNARSGIYNVKPAMLWVGGLFDAEDCWGAWNSYKACESQSPQTNSKIVMGPWYHGQWSREGSYLGNVRFGSNTSAYYQQQIEIPFFNYYLKNKGNVDALAEANIFFTGENKWKTFTSWPPAAVQNKKIVLADKNRLQFADEMGSKKSANPNAGNTFYEYTSDPAHPVPYTEGVQTERTREYMTDDQRFASSRTDVLSFEMDELSKDLTLAGPVIADLVTSISTTDADFVVKLIDVFPDTFSYENSIVGNGKDYPMGGYQMLVRAEIMRGKFRNSFENPEAFVPGKPYHVKFELPDVAHTFKKGHRLMIQVQSSWFPLTDRNPQQFMNIYEANDADFIKSDVRIHHTESNQTSFLLPVMP